MCSCRNEDNRPGSVIGPRFVVNCDLPIPALDGLPPTPRRRSTLAAPDHPAGSRALPPKRLPGPRDHGPRSMHTTPRCPARGPAARPYGLHGDALSDPILREGRSPERDALPEGPDGQSPTRPRRSPRPRTPLLAAPPRWPPSRGPRPRRWRPFHPDRHLISVPWKMPQYPGRPCRTPDLCRLSMTKVTLDDPPAASGRR